MTNNDQKPSSTGDDSNISNSPPPPASSNNQDSSSICIELIFCFEQKNFLYIVGSNNSKTKHRVLKIDRRVKNNLSIQHNQHVFSTKDLNDYMRRENVGFSSKFLSNPKDLAFGIVGFVRFLEGYYLILIVKRRCVAIIGSHCIYKIEDTRMLYIPNEDKTNADEQRYLKIFNNVDLKSNFYFSYTYDLSNTLQYNLSPFYSTNIDQFKCGFGHQKTLWDISEDFITKINYDIAKENCIYIKPNMKFVWNEHLLLPCMFHVPNDFLLYICHGVVIQALLPIVGRNLIITLIARRSKKFAGTRFLKRGANCEGFPANEVETEQIVHDGNISSFRHGLFTSFVQIRGSVPTYWSQNTTKIVPKPPIVVDIKDPFYEAAGKHFNNLLYNYGSPIIVLNLVKRKEKKPHESILYTEFEQAIEYLNQFLPKKHQLILAGFDMARLNKTNNSNVLNMLSNIAIYTLKRTGYFQNRPIAINKQDDWIKHVNTENIDWFENDGPIMQTGITRVNCVDCLDRTNTAQFVIGRTVLARQLYTIGAIPEPELDVDNDIVRMLEELYDDHGDTLALQYGGSQLVHRIKTYRKKAPLSQQSKDIMQSLTRYYSNAFSDWDKQNAINLFLGIYKVDKNMPIWSMLSDYNIHHNFVDVNFNSQNSPLQHIGYTKWWSDEVALCLPRAAKEFFKDAKNASPYEQFFFKYISTYDWFFDVHRLYEKSELTNTFLFTMKKPKTRVSLNISSSNDDSDSDDKDIYDGEPFVFRFKNDSISIGVGCVQEEKEAQLYQNDEKSSSDDSCDKFGADSSTELNEHQISEATKKEYEQMFHSIYEIISPTHSQNSELINEYQNYLNFAEKFENFLINNDHSDEYDDEKLEPSILLDFNLSQMEMAKKI